MELIVFGTLKGKRTPVRFRVGVELEDPEGRGEGELEQPSCADPRVLPGNVPQVHRPIMLGAIS